VRRAACFTLKLGPLASPRVVADTVFDSARSFFRGG
jgi:hypothetical protein